ncbi:MAG: hypothetical protein JRH15_18670, partial [Deltaproteobacteria bacterium]|nr:hypothetical protein [Deltaproteobacteria bacterium]
MELFSEKSGARSIKKKRVTGVVYLARHISACGFFLFVGMSFFLSGCADDSGYKVVNLSKKQMIANLGSDELDGKTLRVAVAAMISPKETFSSYRLILDYIGKRLDRNVQLIQRRTYSETNDLFLSKEIDLAFICS